MQNSLSLSLNKIMTCSVLINYYTVTHPSSIDRNDEKQKQNKNIKKKPSNLGLINRYKHTKL